MQESIKQCSRCGVIKKLVTDNPKNRHCDVGGKCIMRKLRQMLIKEMASCARIQKIVNPAEDIT